MVQLLIFKEKLSRLVGNSPAGNIDKRFKVVQKKIFQIQNLRDYKGQDKQRGHSSAHTLAACECLRRLGARQAGAVRRAPPNYPEIIPIIQRCPWGCCAWRNYPSAQIISPANQAGRGRPKPFLRYFSPFYYFLLQGNCLVFHCTITPFDH